MSHSTKMAKRATNFTETEKEWLLHYVDRNKKVLECKKSDVNTNGMKIKTWDKIENDFNASSNGEHRSAKVLRKKWENVKKKAKEKVAEERLGMISTGGGPGPTIKFNNEEKRVIEILGGERVSGLKSSLDCDSEELYDEIIVEAEDQDEYTIETELKENGEKAENVSNTLNMQSKWTSMSAESLRQPVTKCLRQVDGDITNTQESELPFTRKRKHVQDKIDKWINNKSNVAEESAVLQNVKTNGEKTLYMLKEKLLKEELIFSAQKHALEIEILELKKQKLQKELGILV